jgi:hypothetical protein
MSANPSQQGWDDYLVNGLAIGTHPSSNPPTFEAMGNHPEILANNYAVNDQAWFNVHITHNYKAGTLVYPHVHWSHDAIGNGEDVWFELSYTPAAGYSVGIFPAVTQFTLVGTPDADADTHQIDEASLAQAFNTNLVIDSIVLCRIKRIANGGTDFDGNVFIHYMDFHVEVDGRVTNERNIPHTKYGG